MIAGSFNSNAPCVAEKERGREQERERERERQRERQREKERERQRETHAERERKMIIRSSNLNAPHATERERKRKSDPYRKSERDTYQIIQLKRAARNRVGYAASAGTKAQEWVCRSESARVAAFSTAAKYNLPSSRAASLTQKSLGQPAGGGGGTSASS